MASIKLKFRPSSVAGREGTLYYQVIHERGCRWLRTDYRILPTEWDDREGTVLIRGDDRRKNRLRLLRERVEWELRQRERAIRQTDGAPRGLTLDELCAAFGRLPPYRSVFVFLQEQVDRKVQASRRGTARTYDSAVRRFREFCRDVDLSFEAMTAGLMERYEGWLAARGLRRNTVAFYLRTLRTLYRRAEEEHVTVNEGIFDRVCTSFVKTAKRAVPEESLRAIRRLDLCDRPALSFARDMFMFSFYMRGMPFVDMAYLRKSDLRYGMVTYSRRKTRRQLTVEWEGEAERIVRHYAGLTRDTPFMLPILKADDGTAFNRVRYMEDYVNRHLKRVGEMAGLKMPLTTYVARHSWASLAQTLGVPVAVISEGMGHNSIKTTQVYLSTITTSAVNAANRMIIERIKRK